MSIGGGTDETMLSIICKYMEILPRKWRISTLPWKLGKQEHDWCCTLKVTSSKYASSGKWISNFAIKMHIRVFHHYHSVFSSVKFLLIWITLKACSLLHSVYSVGYLSFPMTHAKNAEKNVLFIKLYLHFRASKLTIKKQNFHINTAM